MAFLRPEKMTIVRVDRKNKFAVISNDVLNDKRLSWGARGLLAHLLSKPDNWRVILSALINETQASRLPSGRDAVRAFLSELADAGYITRAPARSDDGRIAGMDYTVHDEPQSDQPETDNPGPAHHPLLNTEKTQRTEKAEKPLCASEKTPEAHAIEEAFDRFWKAGMRKIDRKKALSAFRSALKRSGKSADRFALFLAADVKLRTGRQMGFDQMHPTTYLNGERWNDEEPAASASPARTTIHDERANTIAFLTGQTDNHHDENDIFSVNAPRSIR